MSLTMRWVGSTDEELDRVAVTRGRCYGSAGDQVESKYKPGIRADGRASAGDFLLAERDGDAVGTATSLRLTMVVRGGAVACQGVAYVGTIKTARRRGTGETRGVASAVMDELLRVARDRGDVVSALMPFRASYYAHFGYGVVERRNDWTVPLGLLAKSNGNGRVVRFVEGNDWPAVAALRRRVVRAGQCDIETTDAGWANRRRVLGTGQAFVLDSARGNGVSGYLFMTERGGYGDSHLMVDDLLAESPTDATALLAFMGSLKDQHTAAVIPLPVDWPLERLLSEPQVPHRPVEHATASVRHYTRMQVRVLDHATFLGALNVPTTRPGRVNVEIAESEGHVSRFGATFEGDRVAVGPSAGGVPTVRTGDVTWASVVCGDLAASDAARWGLLSGDAAGLSLLNALSAGPKPFCGEYF